MALSDKTPTAGSIILSGAAPSPRQSTDRRSSSSSTAANHNNNHTNRRSSPPAAPAVQPPPSAPPLSTLSAELPLPLKDHIFAHQLRQPRPLSIVPSTIIESGICTGEKDAATVHHGLVKAGVLVDARAEGSGRRKMMHFPGLHLRKRDKEQDHGKVKGRKNSGSEGESDEEVEEFLPQTNAISASLTNQVKVLTVPGVKLLVKVLFFWEEEVVRWRAKEKDEEELVRAREKYTAERAALDDEDGRGPEEEDEEVKAERARLDKMLKEVEFYIQAVRLRQRVKPSERTGDDQLPRYQ